MIPDPGGRVPLTRNPFLDIAPLSRIPYSVPRFTKMKVHPAMFMKTKEGGNFSRPTPRNLGGQRPNPAVAEGAPTPTSGSSILSLKGYPEKFMKTKEG
jgi:hypothetical protein